MNNGFLFISPQIDIYFLTFNLDHRDMMSMFWGNGQDLLKRRSFGVLLKF